MSLKTVASVIAYPALLSGSVFLTWLGIHAGMNPEITGFLVYFLLALAIFALERIMPHEKAWQASDGETGNDLLHTVVGSVFPDFLARGLVMFLFAAPAIWLASHSPVSLWLRDWPMVAQVFLALFVGDFGLYWGHRIAHEWMLFWRFHALHHSPVRLWVVNTGRFHFVDIFKSTLLGMPLLVLLNPPVEIFVWFLAFFNSVGVLTHCNIEMRLGVLNYIFNTPGLHRWHHSRVIAESNHNYGEILILWDLIFGTHYLPAGRPPVNIGIDEAVPRSFLSQIAFPFTMRVTPARTGETSGS